MAISVGCPADHAGRIDTAALKQAYPIKEVIAAYGIELKRQGRAFVGRCPFHADGGRPNLTVFPTTQTGVASDAAPGATS